MDPDRRAGAGATRINPDQRSRWITACGGVLRMKVAGSRRRLHPAQMRVSTAPRPQLARARVSVVALKEHPGHLRRATPLAPGYRSPINNGSKPKSD